MGLVQCTQQEFFKDAYFFRENMAMFSLRFFQGNKPVSHGEEFDAYEFNDQNGKRHSGTPKAFDKFYEANPIVPGQFRSKLCGYAKQIGQNRTEMILVDGSIRSFDPNVYLLLVQGGRIMFFSAQEFPKRFIRDTKEPCFGQVGEEIVKGFLAAPMPRLTPPGTETIRCPGKSGVCIL